MSGYPNDEGSGWWKPILVALGAAAAAVLAWGWLKPAPETPREELQSPEAADAERTTTGGAATQDRRAPAWVRPTVAWTVGLVVAVGIALLLLGALRQVVLYVFLALFFSFALEPAANRLVRRGWRRGSATGLILALTFVLLMGVGLIFVSTLVKGTATLVQQLPEWGEAAETWLSDTFGIEVSTDSLTESSQETADSLDAAAKNPIEVLLGLTFSLIGGIFAMFTVGMFIFYMVAEGPKFKRAVLSFFPRARQEELVSIWEAAIDKTGGYFYSKMTLALINGGLFFVVLIVLGIPSAAALATFQAVVAEFIPIVGTYIAAVVPLTVALMTVGNPETLILLVYVLIYQQVENYLLSPKLQSRAMQLHPAVAFGAALAGGAIGGLLWAFLALPFAATIQASASLWMERHEVVESEFTAEQVTETRHPEREKEGGGFGHRAGSFIRSSRGFLRRGRGKSEEPDAAEPALGASDPVSGPADEVGGAPHRLT